VAADVRAPVRVLVADDNPLVRLGVCAALGRHDAVRVVGQAADGWEAVRLARAQRPDVVLLDVRMPHRDGLSALGDLVPLATVVMLTHADEPETVARAIEAGASGYLVHGTYDLREFLDAVLGAARGLPCASPHAATALVQAVRRRSPLPPGREPAAVAALSGREREVMALIADGLTNEAVGRRLGLTEKTVKNHLQSIYAKLDVHSRAAALSAWLGVAAGC
jgi:DNA-binding NarL/FixJ family response regulator